jgi:hypothetical protein
MATEARPATTAILLMTCILAIVSNDVVGFALSFRFRRQDSATKTTQRKE